MIFILVLICLPVAEVFANRLFVVTFVVSVCSCAVVVTLWPGKLTGIWTATGGNPGPNAFAGMVTAAVPPGTFTV